ncbi:MAG: CRISPR system precrRNA processing endoribonuclease RAMP protein Cas6 [Candidatus Thorarchaeota archaeon]|nr:CRISPR system precrRNA processing endoribonuclease RAMP protein Cas6 [Candidatus Thorarchaeota archaeon]
MISLQFYLQSPFTGSLDFTGTALRGAFLNMLKSDDPELSKTLHDSHETRIYSLVPFPTDTRFQTLFNEGETYNFAVHVLDAGSLRTGIRNLIIRPPKTIRLHHYQFPVSRIDYTQLDFEALMAEWTDEFRSTLCTPYKIVMRFLTPTHLSHYGSDFSTLFPQPERVFPSLLRVWNNIDRLPLIERVSEYRDWVEQKVSISRYNLRTTEIRMGTRRKIIGFIGETVYSIHDNDSPFAALTASLSRFAELSNVGKNRTAGFGRVEVRLGRRGWDRRDQP